MEPCGRCESCVAIASATSLDVIEMDAASNNSVDDIRELRESVQFAPVSGRSKVYILDEAHMLSSQAWNAFLKTLEEPPPHTIFVLATTEAQKVLPTVVDRCHRFDFARPTVEQIATVITRVAAAESIEIAPDAVALLARHATGSFRDALGTLEQLVTYTGTDIATDDVLAVLGVADADLLFEAFDAVAAGDARAAWLAAARLADTGRDIAQFLKDLEAHARDLLVVQTLGEVPAELRLTPDRDERLAEQAARVPGSSLVRLLDLLAEALRTVKDGADARTRLEAALVKAAAPEVDPAARALMARVERLEAALSGAARACAAATRRAEPPRAGRSRHAPRRSRRAAAASPPPARRQAPPSPPSTRRQAAPGEARRAARARDRQPTPEPRPDPDRDRRRRARPRRRPHPVARRPRRRPRRQRPARRLPRRGPSRRGPRQRGRRRLRRARHLQPQDGRRPRAPRHGRRRAARPGRQLAARGLRAARAGGGAPRSSRPRRTSSWHASRRSSTPRRSSPTIRNPTSPEGQP